MAVVRERPVFAILALFSGLALFAATLAGCQSGESRMNQPAGLERANSLASGWSGHLGAADRRLGPDGDMSLGETGLFYQARDNAMFGRVWINMARTEDAPPERLATYHKMLAALNDPHIGGMYDRASGYFVLDEKRQGFYLVRRFDVAQTTPQSLIRDMDRMQRVAGQWNAKWFLDVAMIMHGKEKPPEKTILMEN